MTQRCVEGGFCAYPSYPYPHLWRNRFLFGCLVAAVTAPLASCQRDPRISIREFLSRQPAVAPTQFVATSQPVTAQTVIPVAGLSERARAPYRVGPSDVLRVTLTGVGIDQRGEQTVVSVRVNREGAIVLPMAGTLKVGDMELEDVEQAITDQYVPKIVKTLSVNVEVVAFETTDIVVTGAATLPGLVTLHRNERDIFHAVTRAGGLSSEASGLVKLQRLQVSEEVTLNLMDPAGLQAAFSLAPLESGDLIAVEAATPNTYFVAGLVMAPGPKSYPIGTRVTLLQLLAASGGVREDLLAREATLIRRMADGTDVQVKLDLNRLKAGEDPNIILAAGDIFLVPETPGTKFMDFVNRNLYFRAGVTVNYDPVEFERYRQIQSQQNYFFSQQKRTNLLNPLNTGSGNSLINPYNALRFSSPAATIPTAPTARGTGGS